jgi:hypothetical protein
MSSLHGKHNMQLSRRHSLTGLPGEGSSTRTPAAREVQQRNMSGGVDWFVSLPVRFIICSRPGSSLVEELVLLPPSD